MQKTKVTVNFMCADGAIVEIQMPLFKCGSYSSVIAHCFETTETDPFDWPLPYNKEAALAFKKYVDHEPNWVPIVEAKTPSDIEAEEKGPGKVVDAPPDFDKLKEEFMMPPKNLDSMWLAAFPDRDLRRDLNLIAVYLDVRSLMHLGVHLLADLFIDTAIDANGTKKRILKSITEIKKEWAPVYFALTGKDLYNPDPADLAEIHKLHPWLAERNFPPPPAPQAAVGPQPMEE